MFLCEIVKIRGRYIACPLQSFARLLGNVNQVGHFGGNGGVGRASERIGFGVAEHVGKTKEVASFDDEVADGGLIP